MKGIIFTELVRFMEKIQSPEFADQVLTGAVRRCPMKVHLLPLEIIRRIMHWQWLAKPPKNQGSTPPNFVGCLANTCIIALRFYILI